MQEIADWLKTLGLSEYAARFAENDIDISVLRDLTDQDLKDLGVSLGHRRKMLRAIAELAVAIPASPQSALAEPKSQDTAERRQVTVMFSDLVGSTALSACMDPEDLREVISAYQKCVAETVRRFGGFVAKYMGDGVLVYFGYPEAHEDDAERAVRAGLELIAAVAKFKTHASLQTRIGIATGLVVVGDLIGSGAAQEQAIVGETPNLAARLQALAEPNTVVIADGTRRLLGNLFELRDLGAKDLKGIAGPVRAWAALRRSSVESRFDALHTTGLTALVGREEELELLLRRWSRAKTGEGQVVLLSGEAGIGKSRLTAALLERLASEPHTRLRYFCSPQHTDSAFYPIIGQMERAAGLAHDDTAQVKLDKLDAVLAQTSTSTQDATLFAEMLSLPNDGRYPALDLAPQQRRQKTLEALITQLAGLASQQPVLMIFEDAHWTDPTSLELFGRVVDRIATLRVLLIVAFRPEFEPPWIGRPHVTAITLNRLAQRDIDAMIDRVVGNKQLPADIRQDIIERTDGIPLFVEEMTKAVLEAESEGEARRTTAAVPSSVAAIPASLHASLMARLDRLGPAKEVAQIGAAIGREFSHALLAAVVHKPEAELNSALDRLIGAGLLFRQGVPPHATYLFKHALVQDAAYGTLLREPRRALHARIADTLESEFAEIAENEPTLVAHHCSRAGEAEKSFRYWLLAADRSSQRLAFAESVANLGSALAETERTTDPELRKHLKLDAQLRLGATLAIHKGPQTSEAESALQEAKTLAKEVNAGPQLFQATWGLYLNAARNRRLDKVEILGEELTTISREIGDDDLKFEALHHRWGSAYFFGQTAKMLEYATEGTEHYDRDRHHQSSYVFGGHDPGACAHGARAMALGLSGRGRSVRPALDAGLVLARSLQHPLTLAFFHSLACPGLYIAGDSNGCREFAEQLTQVSARYDFPATRAVGLFMLGAADALQGDVAQALKQMEPSYEATFGYGFLGVLPGVILADALASADRNQEALALVTRLLDKSSTPEVGPFISELWRIRGEIVLRQSANDSQEAERYFGTALRIADKQGANVFRLRAGIPLARMLAEGGRRQEAKSVLDHAAAITLDEWDGPETAIATQLRSDLA